MAILPKNIYIGIAQYYSFHLQVVYVSMCDCV